MGLKQSAGGLIDIVGIDIAKARFDVALLVGHRVRQSAFSNAEAGFHSFRDWLARHRPDASLPLRACMEATGSWGLDLAEALHGAGIRVSIVNPARVEACGASELLHNKTDRLPIPAGPARSGPRGCGIDRPLLPCSGTSSLDAARTPFARAA